MTDIDSRAEKIKKTSVSFLTVLDSVFHENIRWPFILGPLDMTVRFLLRHLSAIHFARKRALLKLQPSAEGMNRMKQKCKN